MAGSDILAGVTAANDSNYTDSEEFHTNDEWICGDVQTWTVTDTGTADGLAVKTGDDSGPNPQVKMIVADSSGNILATSEEVTWAATTWLTADLVSSIEVTVDDVIQLWFAFASGYNDVMTDGTSQGANRDQSGTYATPPDPLDNSADREPEGEPGLRLYGTIGAAGPADEYVPTLPQRIVRHTGRYV